jgi:hypothetical protein
MCELDNKLQTAEYSQSKKYLQVYCEM